MNGLLRAIFLIMGGSAVAGCAIYEIDAPPLSLGDRWIKNGYTKPQIQSALRECGQDQIKSFDDISRTDSCMLRRGFLFIDSPYRYAHKRCDRAVDLEVWNLPSCRSLRGELIIKPDESDSLTPPVVNEKPSGDADKPSITRAPSANPSQQLQWQVQKDSNRQMNDLLKKSTGR